MELSKAIENRRSIRKYKDLPVTEEQVREILTAASLAPSWTNSQPSRYYVAMGDARDAVAAMLPQFNQNNVINAPVLIVPTVVRGTSGYGKDGVARTHLDDGFLHFDNGLRVENICLKALDMGLGSLIMGLYDEKAIREYFEIPDTQEIVCVLSIGYPDIQPDARPRLSVDEIAVFKK
ncbi:MAG: nitroreductase family protein [Oscillospiraceae bacterium]|nr:nitroreductase family protein [Oscillospiraceae bacterium]